jgi:serine/threonine protein kinase/WD40 repeat protein
MPDSSLDRDPLDRLAEEFVQRLRAGQRPSLTEYAQRHPELAEPIHELFPALVEMENLKPATGEHTGAFTPAAEPTDPVRVGEFRILRRVGQGGMGVVYEAVQESLGRHVALKLLPAEAVADPKRRERFRREASAAARLHHTNIVPVFGVGEAEGRHFYAMQFISGHPLDAVIDEVKRLKGQAREQPAAPREVSEVAAALLSGTFTRTAPAPAPNGGAAATATGTLQGGSLPDSTPSAQADAAPALSGSISEGGRSYWATVARIGEQAADALAYAHAQGVLHRDIKPANLLLDLRGTVWVTDFGLAKAADAAGADDLTRAGDIVGTLRYMAPERFDGSGDHRADVYALGLTLYELLTLEPAFAARGRAQLIEQVLAADPPAPRSLAPAIPRDLETIVLKAIARDPAMRYPSAGEMAEDLRRFLEDRPIRARRASSAEQAFRWCRRNKAVAALLTAVLVVFAAGAAVAGFFAVQAEIEREQAEQLRKRAEDGEWNADKARKRADSEAVKVRAEKELTHRLLYISQMNQASVALHEGRIARVVELLIDTTPGPGEPDVRGWEWHYLDRLVRKSSRVVRLDPPTDPDAAPFGPLETSADGRHVLRKRKAAGGGAITFDFWDASTGKRINRVPLAVWDVSDPNLGSDPPSWGWPMSPATPTVSPDGRSVGVWQWLPIDKEKPSSFNRPQLRVLDTEKGSGGPIGSQVGVMAGLGNQVRFDAGGVRWLELATRPGPPARKGGDFTRPGGGVIPTQVREYIAHRWDRATGVIVASQKFRPGTGEGVFEPIFGAANGRVVLFNELKSPPRTRGAPMEPDGRVECWDTGADPPRLLWTGGSARDQWTVSPGGNMVATCSGSVIAVYRAEERADGPAIAWTAELPPASAVGNRVLTAVADDGRVLLTQPGVATVLGPTGKDPANPEVRQWVLYHTPGKRAAGRGVSADVSGPRAFVPGERAVVGIDADGAVRRWDFDAERLTAEPDPVWRSPDGRWAVEYAAPPGQFAAARGSSFLVRDATTGKPLHRLTAPPREGMKCVPSPPPQKLGFLVGSRRFLAEFDYIPSDQNWPQHNPHDEKSTWVLYDTDGWRPVATSDSTWILAGLHIRDGGRGFVSGHVGAGGLTVRDGLTGRVTRDLKLPTGSVVAQFAFDPAGERLLVASCPAGVFSIRGFKSGKKAMDTGPLDLRMLDVATGETVWERTDVAILSGPESGPARMASAQASVHLLLFAPGGRVLVQYRGSDQARRLWVGREADGALERTLEIGPGPQPVEASGGGWLMARPEPLSLDRDGRRAAVIGDEEVRIFDLDTGAVVVTLRGHEAPIMAARLTPDGTRAFTVESMQGTEARRVPRVHVWDVGTGRRVFTIQPPERFARGTTDPGRNNSRWMLSESDRIEFRDGILSVTQFPPYVLSRSEHMLVSRYREPYTLDGNPAGP